MPTVDPIRVLVNKAPEIEAATDEIEAAIDTLYEAVSVLKEHWQTIVLNGEAPTVHEGLIINIENLPTWQKIQEMLAHWHTIDEDYRRTWEQLSDHEMDHLPNLEPDKVEDRSWSSTP